MMFGFVGLQSLDNLYIQPSSYMYSSSFRLFFLPFFTVQKIDNKNKHKFNFDYYII
jgi:hypothetical protein